MNKEIMGTVVSASKQWWLKVNRKPLRMHPMDGATFPYIIKVQYTVEGKLYAKRKWINAGKPVPKVGSEVRMLCDPTNPNKAKFL